MSETNAAGEARNDRDEPSDKKTADNTLGNGELHLPKDDAVLLTDGGHIPGQTQTATNPPNAGAGRPAGTPTRLVELGDFRRDILLTLARSQPTHGQGLRADLGTLRNEHVNDGRFYPHLNALVADGLVEKRENRHDDRSHEYVLTDAGRTSIRDHAQRVTASAAALNQENR